MPSSSSKWVQVSTHTRSPRPLCTTDSTVSVVSSSGGVVASISRCTPNTSSALRGASMTPSEPCSRTSSTIPTSSRSAHTQISSPSARSAAAITISSGILVGSVKLTTVCGSFTAARHARRSVRSSRTSTNAARPVPLSACKPSSSCTTCATTAPCASSGGGVPSGSSSTRVTVGGNGASTAGSAATTPRTRACTAASTTPSSRSWGTCLTSIQANFTRHLSWS